MEKATIEEFNQLKEEGIFLQGVVRLTQFHQGLNTDVVMIETRDHPVYITREDLDYRPVKTSLVNYVGEVITFQINGIDEENDVITGSAKAIKELMLDKLALELERGDVKEATVVKILAYGAYLSIDGISVQMLNKDFSEDYTTIRDILKEGDKLDVVFKRFTDNKNLRVEAKEKHTSETTLSLETLQPNHVVLGVVRNVKPWGAFVGIAPNLDALCPVPANMDIQEGDKVTFKITQVRLDEKRVRGKILKKNEMYI